MSYDEKLGKAKAILEDFNKHVEDSQKVDIEKFVADLKAAGGFSEEMLAEATWEEIEKCGAPRLLAKKIASIFRKKKEKTPSKYVSEKKAASLTTKELLERYDPRNKEENPVSKRLKSITGGEPCIVFSRNGSLHLEASLKCINDILDEYEALNEVIVDGVPHKTYRIGERPASKVPENPLFPGEALRGVDEMCDNTTRSWKPISQEVRVLLRLALEGGELSVDTYNDVHDIFERLGDLSPKKMLANIIRRCPKAKLRYNDLEDEGNLPSLKITRGGSKKVFKKQDPFHGSRNKTF